MYSTLLELENLNQRKYIHGTSLVRGVANEIVKQYQSVQSFKIRLLKPLYFLPVLVIGTESTIKPSAAGSFVADGQTIPYYLVESDIPCTRTLAIDEAELERRVNKWTDRFSIDLNFDEDAIVAWSAIERPCNFALFESLNLIVPGKQMWFTGMELDDLTFLKTPLYSVGSSVKYERPSEFCIRREIFFNQKCIGIRSAVYA